MALNRKNALFAGSDECRDNWAVIATLIEDCKIAVINPHTWLTETLTKLADGHPINSVGELMPWINVGCEQRLLSSGRKEVWKKIMTLSMPHGEIFPSNISMET